MATDPQRNWTCRICASESLPGSFEHCPNCSHPRDWDEDTSLRVQTDPARFAGVDFRCCGFAFSESARFCGHCGTRLRRQRRVDAALPGTEAASCPEDEEGGPTLVPFLALEWLLQES